ncbi:MAG: DUF465 domain-containing protein [Magnetococcales bacterium]|nr:DUF465 domain-containing protein [Magnetococcales bacterium]
MFENQQDVVKKLLESNPEFRELHDKHQDLNNKVHEATTGVVAIDSYSLEKMKKEKLMLKDRMASILNSQMRA